MGILDKFKGFKGAERKIEVDGFWGWVTTFVAFLILMLTIGIIHCLGVFFDIWREELKAKDSQIVWVQSSIYAVIRLGSPLVMLLNKLVSPRLILFIGSVSIAVCFCVSGLWSSHLIMLILVLGCGAGFGCGCCCFTSMHLVGKVMNKFRPVSYGIANCGANVGNLLMPIIANSLIDAFGWRAALASIGSLWLSVSALSWIVDEGSAKEETSGSNDIPEEDEPKESETPFVDGTSKLAENSRAEISGAENTEEEIQNLEKETQAKTTLKLISVLNLKLFHDPVFVLFLLYGLFHYGFMMGILVYLPKILLDCNLSKDSVALLFSLFGVGGIVGTLLTGPLTAFGWFKKKKILVFLLDNVFLIILTGLYLVFKTIHFLGVITALLGLFIEAWFAMMWIMFHELFTLQDTMDASAYFLFVCGISILTSPAVLGQILDTFNTMTYVIYALLGLGLLTFFVQVMLFFVFKRKKSRSLTRRSKNCEKKNHLEL